MRTSCARPSRPLPVQPREGGLLHGIGGEDRLGSLVEVAVFGAERCGKSGQDGDELFRGQRDADDAGGRWKNLFRAAAENAGGGGAGGAGGAETGLASGTVGIAGVDGDNAHAAAGGAQMLLVNDEGRGDDAVRGEGRGSAGRRVRDNEGEVGAAAGLQAGLDGAKAESAGDENESKGRSWAQPI